MGDIDIPGRHGEPEPEPPTYKDPNGWKKYWVAGIAIAVFLAWLYG
jgi:hypothetical protein